MSRLLLSSIVCAAVASHAGAQVATDTGRTIDPVVVTATRNPIAIGDLPASVTVLQGADLRARGIVSVTDALREVPGVAVARNGSVGGVTSLFVRGGQSNYTKVLVDGVPMNQSGGAFNWATLTTDNVERIEVVRGPSSVVWGSDAVTGVVNIITRSGRSGSRASAWASAGTQGTFDSEAQLSRATAAATYSVGLGHHFTDGIYAFNNRYSETVFSGRADAALDEKTDGSFTVRYSDITSHYPTDGTGAAVDSNAYNLASQLALSARVRRLINSRFSIQGLITSSSHDGGTDDAVEQGRDNSSQILEHITRRGVEVRGVGNLAWGSILTVGAQLEEQAQRTNQQFTFGTFSSASVFTVARHDHAAFGELVRTGERTTTTLGARVDGNEQFGSFGTFRAAVQTAVAGHLRARASAGSAFREPSLFENFATGFTVGNPDLEPEHTTSWEAGLEYGRAVKLAATYFNQRFVNMIDYNGAVAPGDPNYRNIAEATASGVEVGLTHPEIHGFRFDASATWLDTKVITPGFDSTSSGFILEGQRLARRPNVSASGRVAYTGIQRLRADVAATFVGHRYDRQFHSFPTPTDEVRLAPYTLVDLSAEYALPAAAGRPMVALTLRAANIGDVQYESVAGFLAPGRTLQGGARISY